MSGEQASILQLELEPELEMLACSPLHAHAR
jgi:hypothetical protein